MGTHPRIFKTPTPLELATGQVNAWLESPSLVILSKHNVCWHELRDFVLKHIAGPAAAPPRGRRAVDGRLRFLMVPGITARNPLVG